MPLPLHCPVCKIEFQHEPTLLNGGHQKEHNCESCNQLLQWDQPYDKTDSSIGPPQECTHELFKRPGGRVPCTKW